MKKIIKKILLGTLIPTATLAIAIPIGVAIPNQTSKVQAKSTNNSINTNVNTESAKDKDNTPFTDYKNEKNIKWNDELLGLIGDKEIKGVDLKDDKTVLEIKLDELEKEFFGLDKNTSQLYALNTLTYHKYIDPNSKENNSLAYLNDTFSKLISNDNGIIKNVSINYVKGKKIEISIPVEKNNYKKTLKLIVSDFGVQKNGTWDIDKVNLQNGVNLNNNNIDLEVDLSKINSDKKWNNLDKSLTNKEVKEIITDKVIEDDGTVAYKLKDEFKNLIVNQNNAIKFLVYASIYESENKIEFIQQAAHKIDGEYSVNALYHTKLIIKNFRKQ